MGALRFQFCVDRIFGSRFIPGDIQDVRLAADLTVFHIALPRSSRRIDGSFIPLAATCALKTSRHEINFCSSTRRKSLFELLAELRNLLLEIVDIFAQPGDFFLHLRDALAVAR